MNRAADWFLVAGIIPVMIFTLDYVLLNPLRGVRPWWRSAVGIMFALLGSSLSLVGIMILVNIYFGPNYPGREIVRFFGYALFTLSTVTLLVTYLMERHSPTPIVFTRTTNRKDTP